MITPRFSLPLLGAALLAASFSICAAPKRPPPKAAAPKAASAPQVPLDPLSEGQLAVAPRVFVGHADCEFKQSVDVQPIAGQPGHFELGFGKQRFHMIPQETTTGAVRLHDPRAEVVWIQIPVKSMLMDQRAGRRLVDACQHGEQKAAAEAIAQAQLAATAAANAASAATQAATAASAATSLAPLPPSLGIAPAAPVSTR